MYFLSFLKASKWPMKPRDDCEVSVSQLEIQPRAFCRRRHITEIIRSCAPDLSTLLKGERIFLPPKTMSKWPQGQTLQFLLIFMLACVTPHKNHRQCKNNVDIYQPTLLSVCGSCLFFLALWVCSFFTAVSPHCLRSPPCAILLAPSWAQSASLAKTEPCCAPVLDKLPACLDLG